ncbi:MAG: CsbD family protein [Solirubrobacteraceae bacterium]
MGPAAPADIRLDRYITAWFVVIVATCLGTTHSDPREAPAMGQKTDKIIGRAKQALGAVTGNETMKREGQRQEDKGKLKGKLGSTIGKTQGALKDLKDKVDRS